MTLPFDPKPLEAFFKEVEEQLGIQLKYLPNETKFPIQLENTQTGISKEQANRLFEFIRAQVDLRDNQIAKVHPSQQTGKVLIDITILAAQKLAEVYGLSFFFDGSDD